MLRIIGAAARASASSPGSAAAAAGALAAAALLAAAIAAAAAAARSPEQLCAEAAPLRAESSAQRPDPGVSSPRGVREGRARRCAGGSELCFPGLARPCSPPGRARPREERTEAPMCWAASPPQSSGTRGTKKAQRRTSAVLFLPAAEETACTKKEKFDYG